MISSVVILLSSVVIMVSSVLCCFLSAILVPRCLCGFVL
jgi:hypothetical protein